MAVSTDAGRLRLSARGVKGGGAKAAALLQPWWQEADCHRDL